MEREQLSAEGSDDAVLAQHCVQGFEVSQIQETEQSCSVVLGAVRGDGSLAVTSRTNESGPAN